MRSRNAGSRCGALNIRVDVTHDRRF